MPKDEKNKNIYLIEEDRGNDLLSIMKNSPKIQNWGMKHVQYIIYEVLKTLLYLHVYYKYV